MFAKTSILVGFVLFAVGAHAQCPNGGVGVGMEQDCLIGNPTSGPSCGDLSGYITSPGTFNSVASKSNLDSVTDLCGLGWTGGARTACDANGNVISVNPPGAGTSVCHSEQITVPLGNFRDLVLLLQPLNNLGNLGQNCG
ncbi:hypothetical protein B0H17DRAFT_1179114 [Mycena rosella]|uniref:Secreted protein n=1 Tax=Mycena rosella TaxID=1033263 RepID=A0AAD7DKI7_MYCRO|nr:hypothetical protein B0H17DRAFT_1179114 [Mycena rosella]